MSSARRACCRERSFHKADRAGSRRVACDLGRRPRAAHAATRAALTSSQLLGVAYCRFVVGIPALVKLDEGILVAALGRTIQRYLDGLLDD